VLFFKNIQTLYYSQRTSYYQRASSNTTQ